MHFLLNISLLIVGFVLLINSAKVFVNASVDIAKRLRIPSLVIGLESINCSKRSFRNLKMEKPKILKNTAS